MNKKLLGHKIFLTRQINFIVLKIKMYCELHYYTHFFSVTLLSTFFFLCWPFIFRLLLLLLFSYSFSLVTSCNGECIHFRTQGKLCNNLLNQSETRTKTDDDKKRSIVHGENEMMMGKKEIE